MVIARVVVIEGFSYTKVAYTTTASSVDEHICTLDIAANDRGAQ